MRRVSDALALRGRRDSLLRQHRKSHLLLVEYLLRTQQSSLRTVRALHNNPVSTSFSCPHLLHWLQRTCTLCRTTLENLQNVPDLLPRCDQLRWSASTRQSGKSERSPAPTRAEGCIVSARVPTTTVDHHPMQKMKDPMTISVMGSTTRLRVRGTKMSELETACQHGRGARGKRTS